MEKGTHVLAIISSRMEMKSDVYPLIASTLCLYDDLENGLLAIPV